MPKNDKIQPRILSGFMELLPADQLAFNAMLDKIRASFELFGFTPLDTTAVELTEILFAKGGGEIDKEIYQIGNRGDDVALRFDLTVPLARYVAQNYGQLTLPFRRYQIGKVWRAERAQKGRFREFYQCDADVIASSDEKTDAELVCLVSEIFTRLSVGKFTIALNNRKILTGLLDSLGLADKSADVLRIIDKLDKIGAQKVWAELAQLAIAEKSITKILDFIKISGTNDQILTKLKSFRIKNDTYQAGLRELSGLVDLLSSFGIDKSNYQIDLSIARGLDYYTGTVYETQLDDYPGIGSVCSGGRYDDLASYYTDKNLPGVGISIGLTRLFYQLKEAGLVEAKVSTPTRVLVIKTDDKYLQKCIQTASDLRQAGINTEVYFADDKLAKQFKYADKLGIENVLIFGEEEARTDSVTWRRMSTGKQQSVEINSIVQALSQ